MKWEGDVTNNFNWRCGLKGDTGKNEERERERKKGLKKRKQERKEWIREKVLSAMSTLRWVGHRMNQFNSGHPIFYIQFFSRGCDFS